MIKKESDHEIVEAVNIAWSKVKTGNELVDRKLWFYGLSKMADDSAAGIPIDIDSAFNLAQLKSKGVEVGN